MRVFACVSSAAVLLLCLFLLGRGVPAILNIGILDFFGTDWAPSQGHFGVLPMLTASLLVTSGAVCVGLPLGLLSAVFLAYFCPKRLYAVLKPLTQLMAGVPSVVYGFFGLTVLAPFFLRLFGRGKGLLTASVLLGLMLLPTVISASESALRAVPKSLYEAARALGMPREKSIFSVVLPAASGIRSAVSLSLSRALGETTAVMMLAGNQAVFPNSLLSGVRTLTANIALEMGYATGLHRDALLACALLLLLLLLRR